MTLQAEHAQDALAVVGVARVGLEKDFGGVKIEAYARGETYSYVPRTLYSEDGASIDRGHATGGSFGASIKIPFAGGDSAPH